MIWETPEILGVGNPGCGGCAVCVRCGHKYYVAFAGALALLVW